MGDIIPLNGGDKLLSQLFHHLMLRNIGAVFQLMHLLHHLGKILWLEALQNVIQHERFLPGELDRLGKGGEIKICFLFTAHKRFPSRFIIYGDWKRTPHETSV